MSQAVLYSFRRCPYAMRARMALTVSGSKYEHREVALRNKPQSMLEASPKGTVPVFITENGDVIDESLTIMRYALSKNDPENWLRDETGFTEKLISLMDGDFKYNLDRYKYASRYEETAKRGDVNLDHRADAVACLKIWEDALSDSQYLLDDAVSLADIATFPFIRQFAATEPDWWELKPLPKTSAWLKTLIESALFNGIMIKYKPWAAA